ncbi:DMT family transporter [Amycolatopsis sp. H6(2020)]|nr:DMT family transporter [Amycolatopsis sp. H6(2020)]
MVAEQAGSVRSPSAGVGWGLLGTLAFSGTLPATRMTVGALEPVMTGLGREVVAGVLAGVALGARSSPRPAGRQWAQLAVVAIGVVVGWPLLVTLALQQTPAVHGAVVVGLVPLFTAVFAIVIAGERAGRGFWILNGIGVAAVLGYGIAEGAGVPRAADLLLLGAAALCGLGFAAGGQLARSFGAWRVICWALVLSLPVLVPVVLAAMWESRLPSEPRAWLGFAYLATVSAFGGFFAWYRGLALGGIARIGQLQLLSPVLAGLWSTVLLGERLAWPAVTAAGAVTACAFLLQRESFGRTS